MTPEFYYPVKPFKLNQGFGENPAYYSKFGWKGHNGLDMYAPHATPLYAPCDGDAFYATDAHGGAGIYIRWPNNVAPQYQIILWHLCTKDDPVYHPTIPTNGSVVSVKAGALIGYTDNSGAPYESSGDHLHFGLMPCKKNTDFSVVATNPDNGYGGCVPPDVFFNGMYAQDIDAIDAAIKASEQVISAVVASPLPVQEKSAFLTALSTLWQKIINLL